MQIQTAALCNAHARSHFFPGSDVCVFDCCMTAGLRFFTNCVWHFHMHQALEFAQHDTIRKKKHLVSSISADKHVIDEQVQQRMTRQVQTDRS